MRQVSIAHILLAGAGGGVIQWAWLLLHGGLPAGEVALFEPAIWLWVSLVLTAVVGSGAALLMQLLAATEKKERARAIAFAVMCGFCWEPALSGLASSFATRYTDREAQNLVAAAQEVSADSEDVSDSSRASMLAERFLDIAPQVQNPLLRQRVSQQTDLLLKGIEQDQDPSAKTEALERIGIAAAGAGQTAILVRTAGSLRDIAAAHPDYSERVDKALTAIDSVERGEAPHRN
jgi:hypothetical protein